MRDAIEAELLNGNKTTYVIAKTLNISNNTVHAIGIRLLGKKQYHCRELQAKAALLHQIDEMHASGIPINDITKELNLTNDYMYKARKEVKTLALTNAPANPDLVEIISLSDDNEATSEVPAAPGQVCHSPRKRKEQGKALPASVKAQHPVSAFAQEQVVPEIPANMVSFKFRGSEFSYIAGSPGSSQAEDSVLRLLEKMVARGML